MSPNKKKSTRREDRIFDEESEDYYSKNVHKSKKHKKSSKNSEIISDKSERHQKRYEKQDDETEEFSKECESRKNDFRKRKHREEYDEYDHFRKESEKDVYGHRSKRSHTDKMQYDDMSSKDKNSKRLKPQDKERYGKWTQEGNDTESFSSRNHGDSDTQTEEPINGKEGRSSKKGKAEKSKNYKTSRRSKSPDKLETRREYRINSTSDEFESHRYSRRSKTPENCESDRDPKRSKTPDKRENYRDSRMSKMQDKFESRRDSRRSKTPDDFETRRESRRSKTPDDFETRRESRRSITPDDFETHRYSRRSKTPDDFETRRDSRRGKLTERNRSYRDKRSSTPDQFKSFRTNDYDRSDKNYYNERENSYRKTSQRSRKFDDGIEDSRKNFRGIGTDRVSEEKEASSKDPDKEPEKVDNTEPLSRRAKIVNINMRTGGAYIPPARLRMMQEQIKDKGSEEYQKIAWEALKKSIIGMTNKVNSSNIGEIVPELFKENIIRGRGVLARAIIQAQAASPTFTRVYAALVAIINTKFPEIGELILKRLIIQYKRGFRRNNKTACLGAGRFLAHLLNQEVAHEVLILEVVTHLLENPTEDSVEISIVVLKECGKKLTQLTPSGMRAIAQRVRDVLHEGSMDVRVRYMIEVFFAVQKDGFKDFEIIPPELDLVEEEDKYTHLINLDDEMDNEEMLNIFQFDPEYVENEEKYKSVVREILGDDSEEEGSGDEEDSEDEEEAKTEENQIIDMTETNVVCLRRKIYLTIQSSLDFEECAHKLLKLELKPGQILEMCYMILDCCAQQRTYEKFFGLLAQRFCQLNKIYVEPFTEIFENSYKTIHRLETNKLRNVAKFFAHLLYTDAISWMVLSNIKLNEEDTTSSSRIFIKILFQELCEYMGLTKLNERVKDFTLQEAFEGLFPRDLPHNTRFAINFFTSIGLGGLTDELREHLKNLPKPPLPIAPIVATPVQSSSGSSSSSSSTSSSSPSSSSSSSSDSDTGSDNNEVKKKQKRKKK